MKQKTTRVTTTNGKRIRLHTDDTLTLAFPGMVESTPASLRAMISQRSLEEIAYSGDYNESSKARKALKLSFQIGSRGCGRRSVQVFDEHSRLLADYNIA